MLIKAFAERPRPNYTFAKTNAVAPGFGRLRGRTSGGGTGSSSRPS